MCRIAGIFNPKAGNLESDILKMRDAMHRGGPDDAGIFIHPELTLALGHRRLSLLDLSSAGHQPMSAADGKLKIVFNGEIYNFKEIRKDLISLGHTFATQTDTEVILHAYQHWGIQAFERFNGMFAFAIWDEEKQELILARDHAGIKPLYYFLQKDVLIFASEIRAFKALNHQWEEDDLWKPLFLLFGHLPEPYTTLKGVKMLGKGEWIKVHLPGMEVTRGTFITEQYEPTIFTTEAALELVRDILPKAVERHLISDAPIGLFLSGGIDSSLLTLLAEPILKQNLQTLSIQFDEAEFSEEAYQKIIINTTNAHHRAFRVTQREFEETLPDIFDAIDQPSIDAINTYFISMYAKRSGLKAVLSGLGADELFGGYPSFQRFGQWKMLSLIPSSLSSYFGNSRYAKLAKLSYERFHPMLNLYLMNRGLYTVERAAAITGVDIKRIEGALAGVALPADIDYNDLNANASMEMNLYMKNQLLKDSDYMSMWHGLEIRVPFLDRELVKAINDVSPSIKFGGRIPKALLIEAFATLLPAEIWHRKKQGFTFPFSQWLKTSASLRPQNKKETDYFNDFSNGKLHWSRYWALKLSGMDYFSRGSHS